MEKLKFGIISLGCDKNRIDSELAIGRLNKNYELVNNPKEADIILVNTCGFIESSKQESINTILEMAEYKKRYKCKILIVTGCLSQRYKEELLELMPEIDIMLGVNNYDKLLESIEEFLKNKNRLSYYDYSDSLITEGERVITTGKSTAYLKISEGCDNLCTYCIIPKIRGKYRSRKMEDIVSEAKTLAQNGVVEIILVAQDTTMYGIDLYKEKKLPALIRELSNIEEIKWIRLLYCYPEEITDELIQEIADNSKVCKYIDMPIQHISNTVLKRMNRRGKKEEIIRSITKMRDKIMDLCLRTSIIVGFPGESDSEFNELKEFVQDIKFNKLGVFKYSQEEDTPASNFDNQIPTEIKEQREKELMLLQQKISKKINMDKIGKVYDVLVEGTKNGMYVGRSFEMAPEIDGEIFFSCDTIVDIGKIVPVKITKALEYDLIGVVYYESC
ncbi:30S ribosomal protein S12 methylthiotransferase RimO [Clostridium sp. SYSU_GA19001]|uniref:30S ribosomal protein S12 methylthiotransferase RimO n=1 Tax=Clostridium caldaquaticum TaxID=2940653 RepID=UPI002076F72F|nr:30S ribosomal protein S12 methylthiotransferase RimO [Clostridium caldaquaticum]